MTVEITDTRQHSASASRRSNVRLRRASLVTSLGLLLCLPLTAVASDWATVPGDSDFRTVLRYEDTDGTTPVAAFEMMVTPVTNAQFLSFVQAQPSWRRDEVPVIFAEGRYLSHWADADVLGERALPDQPVTQVSWFAAQAFCESLGARLPTWVEWELAAAADHLQADARKDPAWRERVLSWYSTPSNTPLNRVAQGDADVHGIHDLHGLVWEWVEDYAAMLVSSDNRQQADPDRLAFCGAGALSTDDRENYPVLMRIAMLSALEADDTTVNLGFRCAKDAGVRTP